MQNFFELAAGIRVASALRIGQAPRAHMILQRAQVYLDRIIEGHAMGASTRMNGLVLLGCLIASGCGTSKDDIPPLVGPEAEIMPSSLEEMEQWSIEPALGLVDASVSSNRVVCSAIRYNSILILSSYSCVRSIAQLQAIESGRSGSMGETLNFERLASYDIALIQARSPKPDSKYWSLRSESIYRFQSYLKPVEDGEQPRYQYGIGVFDGDQQRARVQPVSLRSLWLDHSEPDLANADYDRNCRSRLGSALFKSMKEGPVWVGLLSRPFDSSADLCAPEDGFIFTDLTDPKISALLEEYANKIQ